MTVTDNLPCPSEWLDRMEPVLPIVGTSRDALMAHLRDVDSSGLTTSLHERAQDVPGFEEADLLPLRSFSLYRSLLYALVRTLRPNIVVETGVLHGFSSSFILQAMEDNGTGRLYSVDLPSRDLSLQHEGTMSLPAGRLPGWAIPDHLRGRHDLRLGRSQEILPSLLSSGIVPDLFIHDSLHTYSHIMMELTLVHAFAQPGLVVVVDNVELNDAFQDFVTNVARDGHVVASYDTRERHWAHGVATL